VGGGVEMKYWCFELGRLEGLVGMGRRGEGGGECLYGDGGRVRRGGGSTGEGNAGVERGWCGGE